MALLTAGMVAAKTTLPVIGVPVKSRALSGVDSLYSIVQMPGGVPVATMAIGEAGATNAALFALRLLLSRRQGHCGCALLTLLKNKENRRGVYK